MEKEISLERKQAYTEVVEILKHMESKYVNKIPENIRKHFLENNSKEYSFKINSKLPLNEQKVMKRTLNILAMLNLNYWCEDEEHKKELIKQYKQNDINFQEELRIKYNPENLFENRKKESFIKAQKEVNQENETYVEEYKETFIRRLINKIKSIFAS